MGEQNSRVTGQSARLRPERMTAEDEAIFLRRIERIEFDWMYEEVDRADADYMLSLAQSRVRFDLASPAVRIGG
jgi:hypothetical protein